MAEANLNEETRKHLEALQNLDEGFRGSFLTDATFVEMMISDIITGYFCKDEDRHNLFFSLIMNGSDMTFSGKIRILERLLELRFPDIVKTYPQLIAILDKIRRYRNRLAHAILDTSAPVLEKRFTDRIQLAYYEDGLRKTQIITKEESNERIDECFDILRTLHVIQQRMKNG